MCARGNAPTVGSISILWCAGSCRYNSATVLSLHLAGDLSGEPIRGPCALLLARMAESPAHDSRGMVHFPPLTCYGQPCAGGFDRRNSLPTWGVLRFAGGTSRCDLLRGLAAPSAPVRVQALYKRQLEMDCRTGACSRVHRTVRFSSNNFG